MITIDEIIKECERWGTDVAIDANGWSDEVLYYLKEYKKLKSNNNRHSKESTWDKDIQHEEFLRESQERGRQGIYG